MAAVNFSSASWKTPGFASPLNSISFSTTALPLAESLSEIPSPLLSFTLFPATRLLVLPAPSTTIPPSIAKFSPFANTTLLAITLCAESSRTIPSHWIGVELLSCTMFCRTATQLALLSSMPSVWYEMLFPAIWTAKCPSSPLSLDAGLLTSPLSPPLFG